MLEIITLFLFFLLTNTKRVIIFNNTRWQLAPCSWTVDFLPVLDFEPDCSDPEIDIDPVSVYVRDLPEPPCSNFSRFFSVNFLLLSKKGWGALSFLLRKFYPLGNGFSFFSKAFFFIEL